MSLKYLVRRNMELLSVSARVDSVSEEIEQIDQSSIRESTPQIDNSNFEVVIHNMPKYKNHKELRKYMLSLNLKPKRIQINRDHAYISFENQPDSSEAVSSMNNIRWKGKTLRVKRSFKTSKNEEINQTAKRSAVENQNDSTSNAVSSTPLANLTYEKQLQIKQTESFKTLKKISWDIKAVSDVKPLAGRPHYGILDDIKPAPMIYGYRNKCEFTFGIDAEGRPQIGFLSGRYDPASGITVVSPCECPHVPHPVKNMVKYVREEFIFQNSDCQDKLSLSIYDPVAQTGFWRLLTCKFFKLDFMLIFTVNPRGLPDSTITLVKKRLIEAFFDQSDGTSKPEYRVTSLYISFAEFTSDSPNFELLAGTPFVYESVLNCRFRISPSTFFQTNTAACHILYGVLVDYLSEISGKVRKVDQKPDILLLDICCGSGSIGVCLADYVRKVIGVELNESAILDALVNARSNEKYNCEFLIGKAEEVFLDIQRKKLIDFDQYDKVVAILDPPRKGLGDKIVSALRDCRQITTLIYVSCDPKGASKNFQDLCRRTSKRYKGLPFELRRTTPIWPNRSIIFSIYDAIRSNLSYAVALGVVAGGNCAENKMRTVLESAGTKAPLQYAIVYLTRRISPTGDDASARVSREMSFRQPNGYSILVQIDELTSADQGDVVHFRIFAATVTGVRVDRRGHAMLLECFKQILTMITGDHFDVEWLEPFAVASTRMN
uniref:tRNA (uracil(54)-C(5))-methyltransferase n=1 Tax=Romanomermis culicivorax TaxID=13658 RepID=A0A915J2Z5_ROMCU